MGMLIAHIGPCASTVRFVCHAAIHSILWFSSRRLRSTSSRYPVPSTTTPRAPHPKPLTLHPTPQIYTFQARNSNIEPLGAGLLLVVRKVESGVSGLIAYPLSKNSRGRYPRLSTANPFYIILPPVYYPHLGSHSVVSLR